MESTEIRSLSANSLFQTLSVYTNPVGPGSKHLFLAVYCNACLLFVASVVDVMCVCVSACPLPSRASPLPEPRAQPGLSGVIPWKGMTAPQCLEMAALAAISSSKKRAH